MTPHRLQQSLRVDKYCKYKLYSVLRPQTHCEPFHTANHFKDCWWLFQLPSSEKTKWSPVHPSQRKMRPFAVLSHLSPRYCPAWLVRALSPGLEHVTRVHQLWTLGRCMNLPQRNLPHWDPQNHIPPPTSYNQGIGINYPCPKMKLRANITRTMPHGSILVIYTTAPLLLQRNAARFKLLGKVNL